MTFKKGDRVRMTEAMRRRIRWRVGSLDDVSPEDVTYAAEVAARRGTVIKVYTARGRVKVHWDQGEINLALPRNLEILDVVDRLAELDTPD